MFARSILRAAVVSLFASCVAIIGTWPPGIAAADTKVKAGIPSFYEGFLPLYAARDLGYFAAEGIDVEIVTFRGGGAAGQAFIAGSIDLCLCSFDHVLKLQERGFDAVAIAGIEEYNAYALIARKGRIGGVGVLKDKTVGITSPGSATDISVRYEIRKAGLDVRNVTLVSIGGANEMRAALENDRIDAGMVIGGTLVDMLATGQWDVLVDFRQERYPLEVAIARRNWLASNGATARRFLKALVRAEVLLQKDPEVALKVTRSMFPTMAEATVTGVAASAIRRLSPDGSIDRRGVATITERQIFAREITKPIPYERLVDLSYLPTE